jgi:23S rRNA pseudouridine1911/1915/1917 synthase
MNESDKIWLVHRHDRVVGGALRFARTQKTAAALSEIIRDRQIAKEYLAVIEGRVTDGVLENLLYKDARQGKAFIVDRERVGVKRARLTYKAISTVTTDRGERTLVKVTLDTGRFHQIRAQFSHIGMPILGDGKYGSREKIPFGIALFSTHISINEAGVSIDARALPDFAAYPWSLFSINEKDFV